ncbi:MAG: helicase C-terminal domain-containing protein [Candidatus Hydrogenedentota bacterium]
MHNYFSPKGHLARDGGRFQFRKEQLAYAQSVDQLIRRGCVGMIEGGTGVGKTLGYLVPHILEAKESGKRVLIATRTKNLQDQIFLHDLPRLAKSMDFTFALLKGRENYLCRERLSDAIDRNELFSASLRGRALSYLDKFDKLHKTGELEIAMDFLRRYGEDGRRAKDDVRATDDTCTSDHRLLCRHYKSIAAAEKADVIVANHHLALLWPETYPEIDRIVIDEAHALEDAATDVYGLRFASGFLVSRLWRLHARSRRNFGTLGRLTKRDWAEFEVDEVVERIEQVRTWISHFNTAAQTFMIRCASGRIRIGGEILAGADWPYLCETSNALAATVAQLAASMQKLFRSIEKIDRLKATAERLQKSSLAFCELSGTISTIFRSDPAPADADAESQVLWSESSPNGHVNFHLTPVDLGPMLRRHLYSRFRSVLLTSATLRVADKFDYLNERLGLNPPDEKTSVIPETAADSSAADPLHPARIFSPLSVGHPFDYESNVLLCLLREPREAGAERFDAGLLARRIESIARASRGRMLALFTNKTRMQAVSQLLDLDGLDVITQYQDGSRHELTRRLRSNPNTVLLGTKSFWEGVDVPGENLSVVVIEKLPFDWPGDPVFEARRQALGDRAFMGYALPRALLGLRQGFGRLIRSEKDRGVVVILDPGKKSYAGAIRSTLPECRTIEGSESDIIPRITAFLDAKEPAESVFLGAVRKSAGDAEGDDGAAQQDLQEIGRIAGNQDKDDGHEVHDEHAGGASRQESEKSAD